MDILVELRTLSFNAEYGTSVSRIFHKLLRAGAKLVWHSGS